MKKTYALLFPCFLFVLFAPEKLIAQSFSGVYNFSSVVSGSSGTGRTDPTPVPTATGVTFGSFQAVPPSSGTGYSLGANPNAGGRFSFTGWPNTATIQTDQYFQVTITPQANTQIVIDKITFTVQRSATGIQNYAVRSSIDNFAGNLVASTTNTNLSVNADNSFIVTNASFANAMAGSSVTINNAAVTDAITIRFYGWGATGTGGTFSLNNVTITGTAISTGGAPIFSATPSLLHFGEQTSGTQSAGQAVTVQATGYGDITVNAPASYAVSLNNSAYASSVTIPQATAQAGTTIYVRFAPATKQLIITDTVVFTNGTDLNAKAVAVSGSSYLKSETFDAGCYNMSFFGSSGSAAIVRTPEQITSQINNIAEVFQHLNLDITGFEEMSSESSLAQMISKLNSISGQTYAALVSDRYSYFFQADDPTFPAQKIGILYNTGTMTLSTTEPPRAMFKNLYDSILNGTATLTNYPTGTSSGFWASGRLPFMATFITNINGVNRKIRYIVIHAKSGADIASYNRRKYDAQVLKDSIDQYYSNGNVIIVGDYNDRLVSSIAAGQPSSYQPFVSDNTHYNLLTYPLDEAGQTSFPGDNGMVDQIAVTSRLTPAYLSNSTQIEPANTYISPYNKVVASDHLPVYARFLPENILPVNFINNLSGAVIDNTVRLSWATASENNNKRFVIQRSTDGSRYSNIGEVTGAGTSSTTHNYQYTDNAPATGINYYRLVQEDIDGTLTTYGTVRLTYNNSSNKGLQVYPNPVNKNSSVTIELANASGVYTATVFTITGNIVLQVKGTIDEINKAVNNNLNQLSAGIYLLQLSNETSKYQAKLIRQ